MMLRKLPLAVMLGVMVAVVADAQLVNGTNINSTDMLMSRVILCASFRKSGKPLPSTCKTGSSSKPTGTSTASGAKSSTSATKLTKTDSGKFNAVASDATFQSYANSNGSTAAEKQLLLQIAASTKTLFEERYAAKGWKNNVAGAFAFFIISNMTVYTGTEPSAASQDALFESLNAIIDQSPGFASAPDKEKQALYNTLIAYSGLPLTVFAEGAQQRNASQVEKARTLAAGYIKMLLKADPETLRPLVS